MLNICCLYFPKINIITYFVLVSLGGVLMLALMAILLSKGLSANLGNLVHPKEEIIKTLWINAIIYFILCILFSILFFYRFMRPASVDQKQVEDDNAEIRSLRETHTAQE
ncbi:hypothetical protein TVAG_462490 [Trichomonas vaginalis G3]|uniref:Uncharacterized protein n=1 Tax=Trichomonas vaginalis (strain ATCC PRA-98 / G3) TaxID=412133 RepID=A2DLW0_TRIV3|nr:hypothetical protein TVAGG3_1012360 [Trichomonas vaginalis G3]EAY18563.1 hypothetical protein TVAG_462490 [Trichomonas vaginalis G3]KAI5491590.1 hypothetical protein TVAGG3_1012360 [Trichomonas vaginalis G3]|eukprot:XP_001579549.1 hypothetical protein [Trichomonas vaginalis G3]